MVRKLAVISELKMMRLISVTFIFNIIVTDIVFGYGGYHQHHGYSQQNHPQPDNNYSFQSRVSPTNKFDEVYKFKQITYRPLVNSSIFFPPYESAIADLPAPEIGRTFIQYNNFPMGVVHYKEKLFITLPRRRPGISATIAYIRVNGAKGSSPSLQAYPSFRSNELHPLGEPDKNRIISVYRSRVDECNRLWFVDTGHLEYSGNSTQIQQPSIWIFDLEIDSLIARIEIPRSIVTDGHGIASITVDVATNDCEDAFGYMPDLVNYQLYVYSLRENRIWSFRHNYFNFDPIRGDFDVAGVQYQWNDGIFSLTLGNRMPDGFRTAYFHSMASVSEFSVSTRVLRNETLSERDYHGKDFKFLGHRGDLAQSAMHAFDKDTGVIFFSQVSLNAIACWNTAKPLQPSNIGIVAKDDEIMIYPADINIDSDGIIWVMTNALPVYNYASLDPNENNYRIWKLSTRDAIRGTVCEL